MSQTSLSSITAHTLVSKQRPSSFHVALVFLCRMSNFETAEFMNLNANCVKNLNKSTSNSIKVKLMKTVSLSDIKYFHNSERFMFFSEIVRFQFIYNQFST